MKTTKNITSNGLTNNFLFLQLSRVVAIVALTLILCANSHATTSMGDFCPNKMIAIVHSIQDGSLDAQEGNPALKKTKVTFSTIRALKGIAEQFTTISFLKYSQANLGIGDHYFISHKKDKLCYMQKLSI